MKIILLPIICVFLSLGFTPHPQNHFAGFTPVMSDKDDLFGSDQVLNIKLSGKIHDLLEDRGDAPALHPLQLSYKGADSNLVTIPVQAKTRGHFRKLAENCNYPPVLLTFGSKDLPANSIFSGQVKLKLVMPCQGDEYVVREWMVYKLYNLISPKSFRARLVRVELDDTEKKKQAKTFFGVLLEDENEMAKRNHMVIADRKLLKMEETEITTFLKMSVFQYLIGNTDWSVQYQQNIKLIAADPKSVPYTVPYDFDHAGIVNTPYAQPAEELELRSTRDRRYRGFCIPDVKEFKETIDFFNHLKESIYNLYTSSPLLDAKYVKSTTQFLDGFYATINDEKKMKADFTYPCNKNGTGNVIIRGLKNN